MKDDDFWYKLIIYINYDNKHKLLCQVHLDIWDVDNHWLENCSLTEHHVDSGSWN